MGPIINTCKLAVELRTRTSQVNMPVIEEQLLQSGSTEKNEIPAKYAPDGDGEKVELVWTHMPNEQIKADKTSRSWHGRWI